MNSPIRSAYSDEKEATKVADGLIEQLGEGPFSFVTVFHSIDLDGGVICGELHRRLGAQVIGASTAGEFTDQVYAKGGTAALAITAAHTPTVHSVLADLSGDVAEGVASAIGKLEQKLARPLKELDSKEWVGVVLIEGTKGKEEAVNEALGNAAPFLSFVGGSAGDNIQFKQSYVHCGEQTSGDGAVLALLHLPRGFRVLKLCNYEPTDVEVTITKVDPGTRILREIDGEPAAERFASLIGTTAEELDFGKFLFNPLGLMIDGEPWLRSAVQVVPGAGILFACRVVEGMKMRLMTGRDIIADTVAGIDTAVAELGGEPSGCVYFNCAYRMMEVETLGLQSDYAATLSRHACAGFHSHGESWLGHINQTLTGLLVK